MSKAPSVIPTSGPIPVDAAAYAIGRKHGAMTPLKAIDGKTNLGERSAAQPLEHVKYTTHNG